MKKTHAFLCACLLIAAGSSFAQSRPGVDTQAQPTEAQLNSPMFAIQGNTAHDGMTGSQLTMQQCQDLAAMQRNNPGMDRNAAQDEKACANLMNRKGAQGMAADGAMSK
jgi:hypothetical protein